MLNSCPDLCCSTMPINPMIGYDMPIYQNIPITANPIIAEDEEVNLGTAIKEGFSTDGAFYQYQATLGASEAAKARERNELKNRIAFLEKQVQRYPDNVSFAIQLDRARARLRELDRR